MAEPILVARRCDAGVVAGGERPVVQFRAEVTGMDIRDHLAGILGLEQIGADEFVERDPFRTRTSIVPFTGVSTVTAANAATTSSDEIGCMRAGETRTVWPTVHDCAMRPTNSKNWVAQTMANLHRGTRGAIDEALPQFHHALQLDPNFASAYAMAAWCQSGAKPTVG